MSRGNTSTKYYDYVIIFVIDTDAVQFAAIISGYTWSETYFRQDLFPAYLFFRRQFHAIVILRFKSISDLDSGSLLRLFGEFIYAKLKIVVPWQRMNVKWPEIRSPVDRVIGFELGLG